MAFSIGVGPADVTDNDGNPTAVVVLNGVTAGRSLAVCVRWTGATFPNSITCTGESSLSLHTRWGDGSRNVQWATLPEVTASGNKTITVTFTGNTSNIGVMAVEIVGGNLADFFDVVANADGSSANPTVDITTLNDGNAILAGCFTSITFELNPGIGYPGDPFV